MIGVAWESNGSVRPVQVDDPTSGSGEALIEVAWCGICGSDLHAFRSGAGISPGRILGHELSGHVVSAPDIEGLNPGDRVVVRPVLACGCCRRCQAGEMNICERQIMVGFDVQGGMAQRMVVPRASSPDAVLRLPAGLDLREAALVEPLAVGLRAARHCASTPGDRGLVIGCGPIGLAVLRFLADQAVLPLVASDPSPLRRRLARVLGATHAIDPTTPDAREASATILGDREGFDFAVDCAGVESALAYAVREVRRGGRVVVAALHGAKVPVSIDRIVSGEVSLLGSFAYRDELRRVVELMAAGRLDAKQMITHEFELDAAQEAFETQGRPAEAVKVMLRIGDAADPGSGRSR
jgi:2-desacetyl-2-hydroxyethyl bacteriochlorophyllide A dehydrogenase